MISFNSPSLTAKVASFQGEFAGHEQLIQYGQFYLTERLTDELLATVRTTIEASPLFPLMPAGFLNEAMNRFRAAFDADSRPDASAFIAIIDAMQLPAELKALFLPSPTAAADVQQMYNTVWADPDIGAAPPWLGFQPTLERINAAFAYEKDKCFPVLRA